jgi:S-DNA-T family DNA segregation ATPase FtsK/SpoIIIE
VSELTSLLELGAPLAALAGGAAYARHHTPRLYWSAVGLPAALVRIQSKWEETMGACELSVTPSMFRIMTTDRGERSQLKREVPKVRSVRPSTIGVRLRVRLARGLTTQSVRDAAEALRHAWEVHAVYVSEVRPGIVDLHLVGFDVLRRVVLPSRMASKAAGPLRVPIALREDGTVFVRDYRTAPHGLALGATDSGKSMYAGTCSPASPGSLWPWRGSTASAAWSRPRSPPDCRHWPRSRMRRWICCGSWSRRRWAAATT